MLVWIQNPFDNLPVEGYRPQRYWLMAQAFLRAGHQVIYWTSDFSHATKCSRWVTDGSLPEGLEIRFVSTRPYARNVSWARICSHREYADTWKRLALKESARPNLIVSSVPSLSGAAAALWLGHRLGIKTILDVQDAWPETFERLAPRWLLSPLRWWAQRMYRRADRVTGVCDRYQNLIGRDDYYRAYLGIELTAQELPVATAATGRIRLLYLGGIGRSYDLDTVIAAVKANVDFELDVAGPGPASTDGERIRFHGYLSRERLLTLMAATDVGVVPMNDDSWVGIPNKVFDYAAAGLPMVSSLTGESAALLTRYGAGVVYRSGAVNDFADATRKAAAIPRFRVREMAVAEFDAQKIYDNYVAEIS